jgi:hypothetical protein
MRRLDCDMASISFSSEDFYKIIWRNSFPQTAACKLSDSSQVWKHNERTETVLNEQIKDNPIFEDKREIWFPKIDFDFY